MFIGTRTHSLMKKRSKKILLDCPFNVKLVASTFELLISESFLSEEGGSKLNSYSMRENLIS
jgi:hypothetical protein